MLCAMVRNLSLPVLLSGGLLLFACGDSSGSRAAGSGGSVGSGGAATGGASAGSSGSGGVAGSGGTGGSGGAAGQLGSSGTGGRSSLPGTGGVGTGGRTNGTGGRGGSGGATSDTSTRDGAVADVAPDDARDTGIPRDAADGAPTGGITGTGGKGTGGGTGSGGTGSGGSTAKVTVWLAGDSTVANGSTPCPVGWGKPFPALFDSRVTVNNYAHGGRSVQTWLYSVSTTKGADGECELASTTYLADWTNTLDGMKSGDYLFIQFGINDGDSSCDRHVGTALFQTYYGMMAKAAKERGAQPVFVTPVSSISCSGSKAVGSRGTYAAATKQAGTTYDVPVIDLEQLSVALYNSLGFCPLPGPDNSTTFASGAIGDFFCEDHTHFEAAGATQIAGLIAQGLRDQKLGLASYLK